LSKESNNKTLSCLTLGGPQHRRGRLWNSHRQRGELFLLSLTRHLTALICQFSQFIHSIIITHLITTPSNSQLITRLSGPIIKAPNLRAPQPHSVEPLLNQFNTKR
jgi:hypothetical protein